MLFDMIVEQNWIVDAEVLPWGQSRNHLDANTTDTPDVGLKAILPHEHFWCHKIRSAPHRHGHHHAAFHLRNLFACAEVGQLTDAMVIYQNI